LAKPHTTLQLPGYRHFGDMEEKADWIRNCQ